MASNTDLVPDLSPDLAESLAHAGGEDERSRKIIAAAYAVLEEEGLDGLTIRAVLSRTGLARRAFYERFAGKDDLVLAVFEQTIRLAADLYTHLANNLPEPMERLEMMVTAIVLGKGAINADATGERSRRGAAFSREHMRLAEARPAELELALKPLTDLFARFLGEAMAAGKVRQADPQRLAVLIYNLVSTTMHTELLAQEAARPDRARRVALAADIWEFCRRAIAA